ncbi:hypothetical protein D9M68_554230 [compost metagenome]
MHNKKRLPHGWQEIRLIIINTILLSTLVIMNWLNIQKVKLKQNLLAITKKELSKFGLELRKMHFTEGFLLYGVATT